MHIVVLHAATHHGVGAGELVRLRTRIVEWGRRQGGFPRLLPVHARWDLTIHDVVTGALYERPGLAQDDADSVLAAWVGEHRDRVAGVVPGGGVRLMPGVGDEARRPYAGPR